MPPSTNNMNDASNNVMQDFSKTCSMMYNKINRKQFEYFQAITQLQEDVKHQVDLIEEYSKKGIVTQEQTIPVIRIINRYIEGYLNYLSLQYDLALSRIQFDHRMLTVINDSLPRLTNMVMERIIQSILPLPQFLIIVVLVVSIFASIDMQQASADDDEGNDNHHNLCKDRHFTKCLHNDGTPLILPFP